MSAIDCTSRQPYPFLRFDWNAARCQRASDARAGAYLKLGSPAGPWAKTLTDGTWRWSCSWRGGGLGGGVGGGRVGGRHTPPPHPGEGFGRADD